MEINMRFKVFLLNGTYVSVAWVVPFQELYLWDHLCLDSNEMFPSLHE